MFPNKYIIIAAVATLALSAYGYQVWQKNRYMEKYSQEKTLKDSYKSSLDLMTEKYQTLMTLSEEKAKAVAELEKKLKETVHEMDKYADGCGNAPIPLEYLRVLQAASR